MIKSICFAIVFLISFDIKAEKFRNDIDCSAMFSEDYIFARFPVLNPKKIWQWHVVERTVERPEYAWIAETGKYKNGKFEGDGFAFSSLIGSADLKNTSPQQGSLGDLINATKKNAFFTKKSPHYLDEQKKDKLNHLSIIRAKIVDDDAVMMMVVDKLATDEGKSGNPTHMKLTAIFPDLKYSYTCTPKIELIKMK
ncbi:uncharacterized protein YbfC [Acidovorax sp. SUPP950]|uniref:hypothetical protein n=1 Tax=Acidovorax sp. SUPP950 TaxID=511901 RepID=UPI0023C3CF0F|nr:hypothetical protein [Acidovorax sp. SUPP950]GKS77337.1 uncharacterized protein YbfC [Acidovorax sp. SUPP950]